VARQEMFYQEATRRLTELPGVVSVAVIDVPPFTQDSTPSDKDWEAPIARPTARKAEDCRRGVTAK